MVHDAIVRDLGSVPGTTVIPPLDIRSKRLQMIRGGIDDATDANAAGVLDAAIVLVVGARADGVALFERAGDRETLLARTDAALTQLPSVITAAHARVAAEHAAATPARAPVTISPVAYAAFLEGQRLAEVEGRFRDGAVLYETAVATDDAFADAWAALAWSLFSADDRSPQETVRTKEAIANARVHGTRLSTASSLIVDALGGWLAHDDAPPEQRAALREPAIAACRALTVKLPEERNGHLLLGRAYRELFNGATEGLRHLEAARRLTPDYYPITQQIAIAWLDIGDRRHAEQALRGFLTMSPGHPQATQLLKGLTRVIPAR
jgi:hypothetical protein